jgi:clan AA aspartic protease (TIGR02281 family)
MSLRNDAQRILFGRPAAAGIVAQLCLASAAWSQSRLESPADPPAIGTTDSSEFGRTGLQSKQQATVSIDAGDGELDRLRIQASPRPNCPAGGACVGDPNGNASPAAAIERDARLGPPAKSPPAATLERSAFIANAWSALDRDVYEQAGVEWAKRGRHDLAVAWLSEAILLDPKASQAYYARGNSRLLLADYGKAIDDYSAVIRIAADHARSYYQRGLAYEKLGQPEKALADFQRRLDEAPTDLEADGAIARVLATLTAKWSGAGLGQIHVIRVASESGDFVVPVVINEEITLKFIVDSGAADVSIPGDVASILMRTGSLKLTDITGEQAYRLADGSEMISKTFTLRSLQVGDIVVENVRATIAPAEGKLLLGQTFLKRFNAWSIDNANHLLLLR